MHDHDFHKLYHGKRRTTPGPTVVVDDGAIYGRILRQQGGIPSWFWGRWATAAELTLLAHAILSDSIDGNVPAEFVAEFALGVVAKFPDSGFTIATWQIESWLQSHNYHPATSK